MIHNEFSPSHYTDLTLVNKKSLEIYDMEHCEWSLSLLQKGDLCSEREILFSERVRIHYVLHKLPFKGQNCLCIFQGVILKVLSM